MNQQPDKLFRDKLSGLSRPVPSAAWDRIHQGLQPPVHRGFSWKIAASLLLPLVAGAAIYLYWHHDVTSGPVADQRHTPAVTPHAKPVPTPVDTTTQPDKTPTTTPVPPPVQRNTYTAHTAPATTTAPRHTDKKSAELLGVTPAPKQGETIPVQAQREPLPTTQTETPFIATTQTSALTSSLVPATTNAPTKTVVVAQERSMTLVFHANETEAYLDKNSLAEATEDGKDASTFKKLVQKARDLKNNQDPIGDLRLKKNEILALNFKNEKRGQNK